MNKIIGRRKEKEYFQTLLDSGRAELLAVLGRRRVGKTFFITKYVEGKKQYIFFYIVGIKDGALEEQLEEFAEAIGNTFYNGASIAIPETWMKAFKELHKAIKSLKGKKKIVIFFDEFPWMVTPKSRAMQALEYYWNRYFANDSRIKFIICGSSASWIIKNIIENKGGLHNRVTGKMHFKPFNLAETKEFLTAKKIELNNNQILQVYMAMGGIPHYLNHIKKKMSVIKNINELCFKEDGLLLNEFEKLFKSLFDNSQAYLELIRIIAQHRYGVSRSDIESRTKLSTSGGRLTKRLKDLESAGFIQSFLPFGHSRQGLYYKLIDEYCYFYLKWIEPEKHTLLTKDEEHMYWSNQVNTPGYKSWAGYAFETICYKHITQIREKLKIDAAARIGTWRHIPKKTSKEDGAQIDLLFECADNSTILCEIKYTNQPFKIDKEYYLRLQKKMKVYGDVTKTKNELFMAMISSCGVKPSLYSEEFIFGTVTLEDLFHKK